MNDLQLVTQKLKAMRQAEVANVAKATNISFPGLIKIKYGTTTNPRFQTVSRLAAYFRKRAA